MNHNKKEILLSGNSTLSDIQEKFTSFFPFLKIDFLKNGKHLNLEKNNTHITRHLIKYGQGNSTQIISLNENRTVLEVCKEIEQLVHMPVEISRRSGKVWNVISLTRGWTLYNQNDAAEFISHEMNNPQG